MKSGVQKKTEAANDASLMWLDGKLQLQNVMLRLKSFRSFIDSN